MDRPLTPAERTPLMTEAGEKRLLWLREHESAPRYNRECGDRLTADGLTRIQEYAQAVRTSPRGGARGERPSWVDGYVRSALAEVPYYRRYVPTAEFDALPTVRREDLVREPWSFVPDSQPLDDLILYHSSQTTGNRVTVLSHPEVPARDLPLMEWLLEREGVRLRRGADHVPIVMVCAHPNTMTYPTVLSYLDEAGYTKINLNPIDWRDPDDRVKFLDACDPDVYSGDPITFHELMQLPLRSRPRALISTAMTLLPGFRRALTEHFGCPVLDLYATNETGIIGCDRGDGLEVFPHDMFVEILRPDGTECDEGERGEIVVTGGNNPFLPLVRYRTGDYARLDFSGPLPRLLQFEPREPVSFKVRDALDLSAHEITQALSELPIAAFRIRHEPSGGLQVEARGPALNLEEVRRALERLVVNAELSITALSPPYDWGGKISQYAST